MPLTGNFQIVWESALENFFFYRTPLEGVRDMFLAIITVFSDELSQLTLIPTVYM